MRSLVSIEQQSPRRPCDITQVINEVFRFIFYKNVNQKSQILYIYEIQYTKVTTILI